MTTNQLEYQKLKETERSNRAKEYETNRSNVAKETETNRTNLVNEGINEFKANDYSQQWKKELPTKYISSIGNLAGGVGKLMSGASSVMGANFSQTPVSGLAALL